jgi:hypothetical protein
VSDTSRPEPLVQVGDVIEVPEADYCYGLGTLIMRITTMTVAPHEVARLEWVRLVGVPIYTQGREGPEREALVRVTALRQQPHRS